MLTYMLLFKEIIKTIAGIITKILITLPHGETQETIPITFNLNNLKTLQMQPLEAFSAIIVAKKDISLGIALVEDLP